MRACQAKLDGAANYCGERLFWPDRRVAAGAAGWWNHWRVAALRGRRTHFGIDAGRRAQHTVGFGKLVAQRLGALSSGGSLGSRRARMRRLLRRAILILDGT